MHMAAELEEAPILVAQTGPLKGQRWILNKTLLIGRDSTCDVSVPERMVSRFHARISHTSQGICLEDLGSKNGTHCNGNPVAHSIILQDGDTLQIALAQQFIYLTSDATMPLADIQAEVQGLRLDARSRRVWVNDVSLDPALSALQFRVLQVLYESQGQVMAREELVSRSWGDEQAVGVSDQALDALLRRLRDRIAEIDPAHEYIVTVRGHGVRLDNPQVE